MYHLLNYNWSCCLQDFACVSCTGTESSLTNPIINTKAFLQHSICHQFVKGHMGNSNATSGLYPTPYFHTEACFGFDNVRNVRNMSRVFSQSQKHTHNHMCLTELLLTDDTVCLSQFSIVFFSHTNITTEKLV